jgi:putative membrane protein
MRQQPVFQPSPAELARVRGVLRVELVLLAAIFVLAAAMARFGGF